MKFITGMLFGVALGIGTFSLMAQPPLHPKIAAAIEHLRDARAYMLRQPHDFGGHREAAIRATDAAIREMEICLRYRYERH
jgi:hypothetical protein